MTGRESSRFGHLGLTDLKMELVLGQIIKTGSRTLKAAVWCLGCLQTFRKVLNPIKSRRKLKTQGIAVGSGETAVLEMPLNLPVLSVSSK